MAQYSVIELATQFDAKRAMWSKSSTEKMLAANYVQMGHLLDAQEQSNKLQQYSISIQSHLCSLAVKTNSLLSDMSSTLDDLKESLARTEDVLSRSLAVQQDHLMLDKRERILKDALFRWSEILNNGEGLADPQWVLIASRTLLTFLKSWEFTTQDLQDAGEKRAFLDLTKRANDFVKRSEEAVVMEVNLFQALYAEFTQLLDTPVNSKLEGQAFKRRKFVMPSPPLSDVSALMEKHFGTGYAGEAIAWITPVGWSHPYFYDLGGWFREGNQKSFIDKCLRVLKGKGETPLVAIYGVLTKGGFKETFATAVTNLSKPAACVIFTDHGIYEYVNPCLKDQYTPPLLTPYAEHFKSYSESDRDALAVFDGISLESGIQNRLDQARAFAKDMGPFWQKYQQEVEQARVDHQQKEEFGQSDWENTKAQIIAEHKDKLAKAAMHINDYLDLHPAVEDFYPRVAVD